MASVRTFKFSIDRGGTFTDVFCDTGERQLVTKLLSEDPSNYRDAPTEGIRRILEQETKIPHPRNTPVDTSRIKYIRMGTTVATNALLERKGEKTALVTTKGFADLQLIGNQSRPKIFELNIKRPSVLYEAVEEIDERIVLLKDGEYTPTDPSRVRKGISQESLYVEKELDVTEVREKLSSILDRGIRSIAVAFLHSYTFAEHENIVKSIALEMGFEQISLSSEIMPMVRIVPRACTTCVDACLTPVIKRYLASFCSGFDNNLLRDVNISFMQSDGGLTPMTSFLGNRAILSGPAGGVVGYASTSRIPIVPGPPFAAATVIPIGTGRPTDFMPVIGFDMGGTSTDVSRFAGEFEHVFETTTAGVTIQSPQLDINTVAAGGGSRLFFKNKIFVVGPESSGAHPGPICYRKNGYLAVTDANLLLGRIQPELFPSIFGEKENQPLDLEGTRKAFELLTVQINESMRGDQQEYTVDEVAYGFIRVANEAMARPIRNLTTMKGYDVTKHVLSCFGGAGPQHCCAIAKSLGMSKIVVHQHSGILSAYGLSLADVVEERQEPCSGQAISPTSFESMLNRLIGLRDSGISALRTIGFADTDITTTSYLNCRYAGTDTAIMTPIELPVHYDAASSGVDIATSTSAFTAIYSREYGFELQGRDILVDDVRVRCVGHNVLSGGSGVAGETENSSGPILTAPSPHSMASVYFEDGRLETPVYLMNQFTDEAAGHGYFSVDGPAIIVQNVATVIVEPACTAAISHSGNIEITVHGGGVKSISSTVVDPIYLSIFSHRFMGIAEQMGRTLQRTSISVNIKERLDFSCALFDRNGGLVANAPHLPVHLGAMSEAVRYQVKHWKALHDAGEVGPDPSGAGPAYENGLEDGDVLVSNHPQLAGGSHLPDITVITPIFSGGKIVFFVASRGHHADIGGIAPGSMPPLSKTLREEGAAIVAFKLVQRGRFQQEGISELLLAPGKWEGNFGTRNLSDNISDLQAQVAANNRGRALVDELVAEYSLEVVQAYMSFIQSAAEVAVRRMLRQFSESRGLDYTNGSVSAEDFLDDGTPIKLKVTINRTDGSAIFDFAGTGHEMYGNLNAPPAVTTSAVIYCLRCLLPDIMDIPLNQGCLAPITISLPGQSLLHPSSTAAVVGGNVLTSQRVTDVILKAFEACAASQGCMNNLTFGDGSMGYYETIAGGSGAGPTYHGTSGVHTHMTNTRITDPEILEKRYPVVLRRFGLRPGSGGKGHFNGGDGVIRELEFMKPLVVSILSERRSFQPYGLHGGSPGERGLNVLRIRASTAPAIGSDSDKVVSLGGKNTVHVKKGDALTIYSPGGGGFGIPTCNTSEDLSSLDETSQKVLPVMTSGSLLDYEMAQESV